MLREDTCAGARRHSILVVDDDPAASDLLAMTMAGAGHEVRRVATGPEALRAVALRRPDLVLLEAQLPDLDGLEVVRRLRHAEAGSIGVIIVSGRAAEHHRLAGFAAGADDYVVKPFSPGEVAARSSAILGRLARRAVGPPTPLVSGRLRVDRQARRVSCDGTPVVVTRIEYGLLLDLISHVGVARTRAQLIDSTWGDVRYADAATVTVHIQRLRKKLVAAGCDADRIQTVRGVGYRLMASA